MLPDAPAYASGNGFSAGPLSTLPSGENCDPWHGQSQLRSNPFQWTMHPRCVHVADRRCSAPSSSRNAAIFFNPSRTSAASVASTSRVTVLLW